MALRCVGLCFLCCRGFRPAQGLAPGTTEADSGSFALHPRTRYQTATRASARDARPHAPQPPRGRRAHPLAHLQDGGASPPRRGPAPARPGPPPGGRPAPPPRPRGRAARSRRPSRASSTQVAGSAVGGAYFPPLCEVEAGGPRAQPAGLLQLPGRRRHSRCSLRPGGPRREARPAWEGAGEELPGPPRRSRGAGRPAVLAPARRRDALRGGLAQPAARNRAGLLR